MYQLAAMQELHRLTEICPNTVLKRYALAIQETEKELELELNARRRPKNKPENDDRLEWRSVRENK